MRRIKELLRLIDARITLLLANEPYLWDWWQLVKDPITYIFLAAFILFLYLIS